MSVPAFLAAVHGRSAEGARAALSPSFQGKANGKPLDREGLVRLLESFWLGFPTGDFTMEPTGGSGRHVITWTFKGEHGGVYLGVPPTGQPVEFSGFIISVSDATGITSLDWKWDPKVFTKAILGPDDIGGLEVKDNFRADPSRRWAHGDGRHGGQRKGKGKGRGPGGKPQGGRQPRPAGAPTEGGTPPSGEGAEAPADGQPRQPGQPGPRSPPGEGKRRRRGKGRGPKPDGATPDQPPMTPNAPMPDGASDSASSAPSAVPSEASEPEPETKPDGT